MEIKSKNKLSFIIGFPTEYLEDLSNRSSECYYPYSLKQKKNGIVKERKIDNPNKELKIVQAAINRKIISPAVDALPSYIVGSRKGKSIKSSVNAHLGAQALLSLDIQNCFPSITRSMVYMMYRDTIGCSPEVAKILTKLTSRRHCLPQGAPTSPGICNLVLAPILENIYTLTLRHGLTLTNYIDDIHISGKYLSLIKIIKPSISVLRHAGFKEKRRKTKLTRKGRGMRVMDISIERNQATIGQHRIRKIRHMINNLKNENDLIYRKQGSVLKSDVIKGCISSVSMISPSQGARLRALYEKKIAEMEYTPEKA